MNSMPKKITGLVLAPRARIIWLALAGFFLGSALCPFNPPGDNGEQSVKQGEIMNSVSENQVNMESKPFSRPTPETRQIETATFALG
jgi:hypothetical protein